jgi:NhaA family Na+:H+ antiporter
LRAQCVDQSLADTYRGLRSQQAFATLERFLHIEAVSGIALFSQSLHFWINDGLMTVFFLVVGMEVRREIHEGGAK